MQQPIELGMTFTPGTALARGYVLLKLRRGHTQTALYTYETPNRPLMFVVTVEHVIVTLTTDKSVAWYALKARRATT